jgi:signal transduction histidine kinase
MSPAHPTGTVRTVRFVLLPASRRARWWIAADCVAAVIVGVEQFNLLIPARELAPILATLPPWQRWIFAAAMSVPVAVRRCWPRRALAIMLTATVAMVAAGIPAASGPALPIGLVLAGVAYSSPRRAALIAIGATTAVLAADALASRLLGQVTDIAAVANVTVVVIAAWSVAFAVRNKRERTADLRTRAVDRAVVQERLRIARELHDVVAHGMGIIAVQSGFGCRVFDAQPEQARAALQAIQTTSREAMAELRHMLGVLRPTGSEPPQAPERAPTPGLADLDALLASIVDAGVHVVLRFTGARRPLPPGLDLAAFRIVQEALTNVVKHAGQGTCNVTLGFRDDELCIEVTDRGSARAMPDPDARGAGHGLIGMRERVAVYQGHLEAAPMPGQGRKPYLHGLCAWSSHCRRRSCLLTCPHARRGDVPATTECPRASERDSRICATRREGSLHASLRARRGRVRRRTVCQRRRPWPRTSPARTKCSALASVRRYGRARMWGACDWFSSLQRA